MCKKVIVDVDDILWDLNDRVCKKSGIEFSSLVSFSVMDNSILSDADKHKLLAEYSNDNNFRNIKWNEGVSNLFDLEKFGADVYINSNNMSYDIRDLKLKQLKKLYKGVSEDKFILSVPSDVREKCIGDNVFILLDDSPYNVAGCNAEYYIVVRKPWNTSSNGLSIMCDKMGSIIFCDTFLEAFDIMKRLLRGV